MVPDLDDRILRAIPRGSASLRLLIGYARALQDPHAAGTAALQRLALTHVCGLVALTLGA